MFFNLFGSEEDRKTMIRGLKSDNEKLTKENKTLKKNFEELHERQEEYEKKRMKKDSEFFREQEESNVAYKRKLKIEQENAIEDAKREARQQVADAEEAAAAVIRDTELNNKDVDLEVGQAVLAEQQKNLGVTSKLEVSVAKATAERDAAEETIVTLQGQIETMTEIIESFAETNSEFASTVIEKLPKVDMSKLSVQVSLPAPEVTVVGNKQEQKTK